MQQIAFVVCKVLKILFYTFPFSYHFPLFSIEFKPQFMHNIHFYFIYWKWWRRTKKIHLLPKPSFMHALFSFVCVLTQWLSFVYLILLYLGILLWVWNFFSFLRRSFMPHQQSCLWLLKLVLGFVRSQSKLLFWELLGSKGWILNLVRLLWSFIYYFC